jgi:SAM-dependent methyltransferase
MGDDPKLVVDAGCGTGIASRLFTRRGCRVVGVEPDPRMAAVARRYGLTVEGGHFEAHSDHGTMAPGQLAEVLAAVGEEIDRVGGRFEMRYYTWLAEARRTADGEPGR